MSDLHKGLVVLLVGSRTGLDKAASLAVVEDALAPERTVVIRVGSKHREWQVGSRFLKHFNYQHLVAQPHGYTFCPAAGDVGQRQRVGLFAEAEDHIYRQLRARLPRGSRRGRRFVACRRPVSGQTHALTISQLIIARVEWPPGVRILHPAPETAGARSTDGAGKFKSLCGFCCYPWYFFVPSAQGNGAFALAGCL